MPSTTEPVSSHIHSECRNIIRCQQQQQFMIQSQISQFVLINNLVVVIVAHLCLPIFVNVSTVYIIYLYTNKIYKCIYTCMCRYVCVYNCYEPEFVVFCFHWLMMNALLAISKHLRLCGRSRRDK